MDTGSLRPYAATAHEPPLRRDDVAGSPAVTDLPMEKTVRPVRATADTTATDDRGARGDHPAVRTGFQRDLDSGSIVYRWIDQTTEKVILEIPRTDRIRSKQSYAGTERPNEDAHRIDRSV